MVDLFGPSFEAPEPQPEQELTVLPLPREDPLDNDDTSSDTESEPQAFEESGGEFVPARRRNWTDELEELWESAVNGQPSAAYARLLELHQQYAGRTEIYLRLYWLRSLWPDVDPRHDPADWLVQGLQATGFAGSLWELYREEVADNPAEALGDRFDQLLEAPIQTNLLVDLIEWRFQAAARLRRWAFLKEDIARFCPRFGPGDDQQWLVLLFDLVDGLAWDEENYGAAQVLLESCRAEIARHEYLAPSMSHNFDRYDLLLAASAGWRDLRRKERVPPILLRLIPASWSRPFPEVRPLLMEVLEAIAGAPPRWLDYLDEVQKCSSATLSLFGQLLGQLEAVAEITPLQPPDRGVLSDLVLAFLPRLNLAAYSRTKERTRLLMFCVNEAIAPEDMAEVAGGFAGGWQELGTAWAQALLNDWPLRYLCRAYRLFWTL
jgi:hypothetical protein